MQLDEKLSAENFDSHNVIDWIYFFKLFNHAPVSPLQFICAVHVLRLRRDAANSLFFETRILNVNLNY